MTPDLTAPQPHETTKPSGANLNEAELQNLLDFFVRQTIEDQLRASLQKSCQHSLQRVESRLRQVDWYARRALRHAR